MIVGARLVRVCYSLDCICEANSEQRAAGCVRTYLGRGFLMEPIVTSEGLIGERFG